MGDKRTRRPEKKKREVIRLWLSLSIQRSGVIG
jgi:hypothetical protein